MSFNSLVQSISSNSDKIIRGSSIHVFGIFFAIILWFLSTAGFFNQFDSTMYNYYTKWTMKFGQEVQNVLLVEYRPEDWNIKSEDWENALDLLQAMGAKEIIFSHFLTNVNKPFWEKAASAKNIIFGRNVIVDPKNPDQNMLEPISPEIENYHLAFGSVGIPSSTYGMHRSENVQDTLGDKKVDTLETAAAQHFLARPIQLGENDYLINFSGGVDRLPKIPFEKILQKNVLPEMVKDKAVLIGYAKSPTELGLTTPGSNPDYPLSLAEFQAFSLDTLLEDKIIHETPAWINLVVFLSIALISTFLYVQLEARTVVIVSLGLIGAYVLGSLFLLLNLRLWLPVMEILTEQTLLLVIFFYRKSFLENISVMNMVMDLTVKLQEKISPTGFYISQEYWNQIITMVDQVLNLNKIIFLARVKGDHRLREVVGLRCSINDIHEQRRDYFREPYKSALEQNHMIEANREYFKNKEPTETEYLVPLNFGGDIVGFWAFTVTTKIKVALLESDKTIQDFKNQISEMLYQHQLYEENRKLQSHFLLKYWFFEKSDIYNKLQKMITVYNKHLMVQESIFDGLDVSTILYDLFGRVLKINKNMSDLMREEQMTPFVLTASDLLGKLTDLDAEQAKDCIKLVILDHRVLNFPTKLKSKPQNHYVLTVRALHAESQKISSEDEAYPFRSLGILYELTDITKIEEFYKIKEEVLNRIKIQFSGDLQSVLLALYLLENKVLEPLKKERVIEIARFKTSSSVAFITDAQRLLDIDLQYKFVKKYPINPKAPIARTIEVLINELSLKNLTLNQDLPEIISLAFAAPEEIFELIQCIVKYLILDAVQGGQLQITLVEDINSIVFTLSNKGFGMPNETLRSYLQGSGYLSIPELKNIKDLIPNVAEWEGEFEVYSEIGVGTKFTLKLKRFI